MTSSPTWLRMAWPSSSTTSAAIPGTGPEKEQGLIGVNGSAADDAAGDLGAAGVVDDGAAPVADDLEGPVPGREFHGSPLAPRTRSLLRSCFLTGSSPWAISERTTVGAMPMMVTPWRSAIVPEAVGRWDSRGCPRRGPEWRQASRYR